ncbi:hypothetical protein HHK36_032957 [Tetracentron sinense]|uniref:Uncharacterized protein n=1 Tax=Tetracentron sinense TaxID=13715 RepID=A0A834Y7A5_TETSI|nr:hypothetical protein HHK36_032957 [Tetracentron sinense]
MVAIFLFLLLSAFSTATAQQKHSNISLGSSLSPSTNSSWLSRSGRFTFGFYPQGNGFSIGVWFTGTSKQTVVVWTANRDDPPVSSDASLLLTSDGGLILQPTQGRNKSIADIPQFASSASMLDSGNFVIYNSSWVIIWQSFDFPTDTMLPGQYLSAGKQLFSIVFETDHSTGKFQLKMQNDGNLVLYPIETPDIAQYAYWASDTGNIGDNTSLHLDDNGLLLGRNGSWSIKSSSPNDACVPKGICGVNGYCTLINEKSACNCLPGFDFIDQGQQSLGCRRNFSEDGCKNKNEKIKYAIYTLESTIWEDDAYSILSYTTKEDCREACLEDCNCEAVLFKDTECKKQKLPVRYGRIQSSDSTTAFVKVGITSAGGSGNYTPATTTTRAVARESKKEPRMNFLIISVAFATCAFIVLTISSVLINRRRVWAYKNLSDQGNVGLTEDVSLRSFTYAELEKVTTGFKEVVGRGVSGTVFKGILSNGQTVVAVKRLENVVMVLSCLPMGVGFKALSTPPVELPSAPESLVELPQAPESLMELPPDPESLAELPPAPESPVELPSAPESLVELPQTPESLVELPPALKSLVELHQPLSHLWRYHQLESLEEIPLVPKSFVELPPFVVLLSIFLNNLVLDLKLTVLLFRASIWHDTLPNHLNNVSDCTRRSPCIAGDWNELFTSKDPSKSIRDAETNITNTLRAKREFHYDK